MKNINLISCLQSVLDWCPYIALGRLGGRTNRARRLAIPSQAGPEQIYSHNLGSDNMLTQKDTSLPCRVSLILNMDQQKWCEFGCFFLYLLNIIRMMYFNVFLCKVIVKDMSIAVTWICRSCSMYF